MSFRADGDRRWTVPRRTTEAPAHPSVRRRATLADHPVAMDDLPPSVVERLGSPGAGSAGRGHGAARPDPVHRAGRLRQDDDARRACRLADRDRDAGRRDPGDHLQQAGRGRDDRAPRCGRGAAGRRPRRGPRPDVPRPGPRDPRRCRGRGGSARRSRGDPDGDRRRGPTRRRGSAWTRSSRGSRSSFGSTRREVAADPDAGPIARAFVDYERALAAAGGLDFDDLILRAIRCLEADPALLARWRSRCRELLVDEVQDVDRAQLDLALLLAAPANRIFLVGDDDQSIYGWRLADVRRILSLDEPPAGPAPRGSRGQLPVPASGRRAGGPARRAQRAAVREAHPLRPGRPMAASSSRPTRRTSPSASSEPCGPGRTTARPAPSSPGRTASCSRPSPSRSNWACRSGRRGSTCRSSPSWSTPAGRAPSRLAPPGEPALVSIGRRPRDDGRGAGERRIAGSLLALGRRAAGRRDGNRPASARLRGRRSRRHGPGSPTSDATTPP